MTTINLSVDAATEKPCILNVTSNNVTINYSKSLIDANGNIIFPGEQDVFRLMPLASDSDTVKAQKALLSTAIETAFGAYYKAINNL